MTGSWGHAQMITTTPMVSNQADIVPYRKLAATTKGMFLGDENWR